MKKVLSVLIFLLGAVCFGQSITASRGYSKVVNMNKMYNIACDFYYTKDLSTDSVTGYVCIGFGKPEVRSNRSEKLSKTELESVIAYTEKILALTESDDFMKTRCSVTAQTNDVEIKLRFTKEDEPIFEMNCSNTYLSFAGTKQIGELIKALKKVDSLYDECYAEFLQIPMK